MKFKVDENLPQEAAEFLRAAGHDAVTVQDQQLEGTSDAILYSICQTEDRAVVTLDVEFADIRTYPPAGSAGVILFRLAFQDKHYVLNWFNRTIPLLAVEPVRGRLWVVDERGVRIRGGEE